MSFYMYNFVCSVICRKRHRSKKYGFEKGPDNDVTIKNVSYNPYSASPEGNISSLQMFVSLPPISKIYPSLEICIHSFMPRAAHLPCVHILCKPLATL